MPEPTSIQKYLSEISNGKNFFVNKMQSDNSGKICLVKVTANGIPDQGMKLPQIIRFSENWNTCCLCGVAAFRGFFHQKDDFRS